jgi:hypothetical protein
MKLGDLPQFTVDDIQSGPEEGSTIIVGHLSHTRGVRNTRGYLYRAHGPSLMVDLDAIPSSSADPVRVRTADAEYAPELKRGASYPWLDGSWQPYHLKMVLSPANRWQRRTFTAAPARYFMLDGVTGWQSPDAELPLGATDLGVRSGEWNAERCELCPEELECSRSSEGFVDPDGRWICAHCFESYAKRNDIAFAIGGDEDPPNPGA